MLEVLNLRLVIAYEDTENNNRHGQHDTYKLSANIVLTHFVRAFPLRVTVALNDNFIRFASAQNKSSATSYIDFFLCAASSRSSVRASSEIFTVTILRNVLQLLLACQEGSW